MTRRRTMLLVLILGTVLVLGFAGLYYVLTPSFDFSIAASAGIPRHPVIAHRGASYWAPEETEPAYFLARDLGADYLEMDIQRTKERALIALHDGTLERTTNVATVFPGREKDAVDTFTLDEIKQLDAGSWFNGHNPSRAREKYRGVKILTLDEVITIAESGEKRPALYIETKSPGYERELVDVLKRRGWLGRFPDTGLSKVVFQSFHKSSLQQLKDLAPEVPRVLLINAAPDGWDAVVRDAVETGHGMGPVGYLAWPWNIRKAHKAGLVVHVYTINATWQYRLFTFFGVDGFFTDRCDQLLRFYGRMPTARPQDILAKYGY